MKKIQFVKNFNDIKLGIEKIPDDTYVIYHDAYEVPQIEGVEKYLKFSEFKRIYNIMHANMFIFFGLNKIITPSNRTKFIFEFLYTLSNDIEKISIDYVPFSGEPWKLWFHYGLCKCGNFGVPYSYAIETEWKHWFYREQANSKFDKQNIGLCISDTYSNLDYLEHKVEFIPIDSSEHEWYDNVKEHVFSKYGTPKLLINGMMKECNKKYNLKYTLYSYLKTEYKLPDFPIYRFLYDENIRRMNIYNEVIRKGK